MVTLAAYIVLLCVLCSHRVLGFCVNSLYITHAHIELPLCTCVRVLIVLHRVLHCYHCHVYTDVTQAALTPAFVQANSTCTEAHTAATDTLDTTFIKVAKYSAFH